MSSWLLILLIVVGCVFILFFLVFSAVTFIRKCRSGYDVQGPSNQQNRTLIEDARKKANEENPADSSTINLDQNPDSTSNQNPLPQPSVCYENEQNKQPNIDSKEEKENQPNVKDQTEQQIEDNQDKNIIVEEERKGQNEEITVTNANSNGTSNDHQISDNSCDKNSEENITAHAAEASNDTSEPNTNINNNNNATTQATENDNEKVISYKNLIRNFKFDTGDPEYMKLDEELGKDINSDNDQNIIEELKKLRNILRKEAVENKRKNILNVEVKYLADLLHIESELPELEKEIKIDNKTAEYLEYLDNRIEKLQEISDRVNSRKCPNLKQKKTALNKKLSELADVIDSFKEQADK